MVTYAFSVTYMFYAKINDPVLGPPGVRILLTFRGLAGYIGISGSYYSLQYLPLADAVALTFLTPICTAILGTLILKEKFGIKELLELFNWRYSHCSAPIYFWYHRTSQ
ncbi:hypothetical protein M378DRAFT_174381 [Amanita muscaria Koide BX008]|uniref:EamA domain-containing protein n=1 Tax=Amanita muscaria (strain Koide BX008) TaxID=946122 RepID=A0A0C2RVF3_AMAMK|nr:hypothetical protein M378DRAFT_174381 [Amanita muscaria Koide BX008]